MGHCFLFIFFSSPSFSKLFWALLSSAWVQETLMRKGKEGTPPLTDRFKTLLPDSIRSQTIRGGSLPELYVSCCRNSEWVPSSNTAQMKIYSSGCSGWDECKWLQVLVIYNRQICRQQNLNKQFKNKSMSTLHRWPFGFRHTLNIIYIYI